MHITRFTDYSLRVLMYAGLRDGELCTIQEIADSYNISKNHLMKVVQELNIKGYLKAVRGKNGGLTLGRPANEINLGSLVRDTEQDFNIVECFSEADTCTITPNCKLKSILAQALNAFLGVLDDYTLEDLLAPRTKAPLMKLLFTDK